MEVGQQWGRAQTMADGLTKLEAATGRWEDEDSCADPRDLGEWLQRLRPALSAFLLRKLRDPADLHDALQEASLRAWRYTARAEVRAPVSLCFRIAQNVAIDFARAHNRAPSTTQEDEVEQHAADDPGPEHCAAAMQELELAKRVIGRLPPGCRHVFLRSRSHGLSNLEIAARCGVSIKWVGRSEEEKAESQTRMSI